MAGASGNSEGQLESVEEQLRGLEVRIRIVEEQISELDDRIRLVEEKVLKCSDDEERKLLLVKEAQLRKEKAQLRDEKFQLLQGRGGFECYISSSFLSFHVFGCCWIVERGCMSRLPE
jgi:predicted  nucleic acid-binding Zn-ribbon protein